MCCPFFLRVKTSRVLLFSLLLFTLTFVLFFFGCFSRVDLYDMVTTPKILVKIGDEYLYEGSGLCDFGEVPMYESSELVLTVENSGSSSLHITSISAVSGDRTEFFMDVTSPISQISAGSSTTFSLVFKPTSTGYRSAIFRIESSDGESFSFTAIGYGTSNTIEPDIQVKQGRDDLPFQYGLFDFGHVLLEHSSTEVVFTIENTGAEALSIHNINFVSGDTDQFHLTVYPLNIVSGGENTTFSVTFDPLSLGYKSTTLSIESNDPDENPYEVTLEGYGDSQLVPDISVPSTEPTWKL